MAPEDMAEAGGDGAARALGEVLNLRHLLHDNVRRRRLLEIGQTIRAGLPEEFNELDNAERAEAVAFARIGKEDAEHYRVRLNAERRYLEGAIADEACVLGTLHADDLRYLDRLVGVWVATRHKGIARSVLDKLGRALQAGNEAFAVTVAVIDGEVEVEQVPVPAELRRRAKG